MPPKISPAVLAIIKERNLCVWHASNVQRVENGKRVFDFAWIGLLGPGQNWIAYGRGANGDEAALAALRSTHLRAGEPGLVGAMARLEAAINSTRTQIICNMLGLDEDVPF